MPGFQIKSPLFYISAMLLSLPVTAIIGFVIFYPVYGISGDPVYPFFLIVTGTLFYLFICSWALYGSDKTAEAVYRICKFGSLVSLLLPVSAGMISLIWTTGVFERPTGFLTDYSALEIPVFAAAAAIVLIILFLTGSYLAAKDIEGIQF